MLRANSYIRECADYLEHARDALPKDRMLVAWSRLIMIAEEISVSFCYDDPGGIASIAELRTQLMHKDFKGRLEAWYDGVADADMNGSLKIMYFTVRLYLHEIVLHIDHSPEDFRAPYQMGWIHSPGGADVPTPVLAEILADCTQCAHALLDTFLAMDVDSCRALPVFSFVRVSFAAFILAKLCLSASHPSSRIGQILDRSSLKAEKYLDGGILHVREIVGPLRCRVPAIFLALLFKLRQWCMHPQMIEASQPERSPFLELDGGDSIDTMQTAAPGRAKITIEGPRITEQSSSSDASPQTLAGGQQMAFESVAGPAAQAAAYQASSGLTPDTVLNFSSGGVSGATGQVDSHFGFGAGNMQLDADFFASLGDMAGFPEGGLTGLDDWIPNGMTGFENMNDLPYDWQADTGAGGHSTGFG